MPKHFAQVGQSLSRPSLSDKAGNLIQTILKHDLVDELWLKIFPITLGPGKRLFAEGTIPAAFKLIDSKITPLGVIVANYKRSGEVKTVSLGA